MAGKVIRSVSAKFTADISDFEKKLRSMSKQMKSHGEQMKKFGQAWTKAVTVPLMAIGTAAIKMAMDAQESENLFNVSMGNMADKARMWSEDLKKSLGLSAYELRKNVATLNSMIGSMGLNEQAAFDMSTSLTKLSADLASFYNISADDALQKLKSGLMGEAEPMKALGVLVNETTIKAWALKKGLIAQGQEMTEQQKVLARYYVMMEATTKAQGDLARTINSPTNRLRIMKSQVKDLAIELGNKLMPAFTQLLDMAKQVLLWVQGLVDKFNALDEESQQTAVKMALLAAAIGPVAWAIGSVTAALATFASSGGLAVMGKLAALAVVIAGAEIGRQKFLGKMESGDYTIDPIKGMVKAPSYVGNSQRMADAAGRQAAHATPAANPAAASAMAAYNKIMGRVESATAKQESLKGLVDMQAYFKSLGKEMDSVVTSATTKTDTFTDTVRSMVSALKDQTKAFADFVGLFDVFERKSVSGERLLTRLKAQVKAMGDWRKSMSVLESRGVSGQMLNDLRSMGPSAVDSINALAGMSDSKLKEYIGLYGQKGAIGGTEAAKLVGSQNAIETNIEKQVIINATGSKGDAEAIANVIMKKLRLAGYAI